MASRAMLSMTFNYHLNQFQTDFNFGMFGSRCWEWLEIWKQLRMGIDLETLLISVVIQRMLRTAMFVHSIVWACERVPETSVSLTSCSTCISCPVLNRSTLTGFWASAPPFNLQYWRTPLIRINLDGDPSGYAKKIRTIGFLFENRLHWQFEAEKKFLPTAVLGYIFIYLQIKH
jgi:hypothetical protein